MIVYLQNRYERSIISRLSTVQPPCYGTTHKRAAALLQWFDNVSTVQPPMLQYNAQTRSRATAVV